MTGDEYWLGQQAVRAQNASLTAAAVDGAHRWSIETFGPAYPATAIVDHIRKELKEILDAPDDLEEWVDVIILAMDGAQRAGHDARDIFAAILAKHAKNRARTWPDWRTADPDKAIEHVRPASYVDEYREGLVGA